MSSSGILRRVALVRTDISEELSAYFIRVTRICEPGTTLAVTSNRRTLLVSSGQRGGSPTVVNLSFLDRSRYFSFKQLLIYPHKG
jgi:hypothetical protein